MLQYSRNSMMPVAWACILLGTLSKAVPVPNTDDSACQARPYTINVDPSFIEQTQLKVSSFRPTLDIQQPAWSDGPPTSNITELARYWDEEYDWFAVQDRLNEEFDHYSTTVPAPGGNYHDPLDIHFIHQKGEREDAIPLLMLHGWPSTSLEWETIIPGLVDPQDDSKTAFHVVAPDLPGFGFSPAPITPGLGPSEHAAAMASLMHQLGYDRYAVYSTDLGFVVALALVPDYAPQIINHVTDFYFVLPNATDLERFAANQTTSEENQYITSVNAFFTNHSAYSAIHSTLPLSIAHALNDSPVGFLAWMWQLVYTVSDELYSASELITQALLLYIPGVYGNIRSYKELFPTLQALADGLVEQSAVPTSVLQFGGLNGYPVLQYANFAVSKPDRLARAYLRCSYRR